MSYNLCFIKFFVWPTLIGAAILKKPKNRIRMNRDGSEKKFIHIKPYISYNWCFINFFLRPLLLGAPLVNVGTISKAAPIRVGHTKNFINKELNFIYDFGKYNFFASPPDQSGSENPGSKDSRIRRFGKLDFWIWINT